MDATALINHLTEDHGIDRGVAREVIAGWVGDGFTRCDDYLRGFHDGLHGRVDADDHYNAWHASGRRHPA